MDECSGGDGEGSMVHLLCVYTYRLLSMVNAMNFKKEEYGDGIKMKGDKIGIITYNYFHPMSVLTFPEPTTQSVTI